MPDENIEDGTPITSAETSVNKDRVPYLFMAAAASGLIRKGASVLDYGCGRWPQKAARFLLDHGASRADSFDPNWGPTEIDPPPGGYDLICLSNVLNVIPTHAGRAEALRRAWSLLAPRGRILVTVYEGGARSQALGPGPSKPGCWQERRPLESYAALELAPYLGGIVRGAHLWESMPRPAPGKAWLPPIGAKATIARPYGAEIPCTVCRIERGRPVLRRCRLEFDGPRYYDTVADRILPGGPGEGEVALSWRRKASEWREPGRYGGAVLWGIWAHAPNLD